MASGFSVGLEIKDMFFDRQAVIDQVSADNRRKLSKAGAFIRTRARSKLRRRRKAASAGQPPSVHSRDSRTSLKFILFGLSDDQSVVIGPVGLSGHQLQGASATTIPQLMEMGGTATLDGKRVRYAAHPFMGPALAEETNNIAAMWGE